MINENQSKKSKVIEILLLIPTLVWLYSPIIAGILYAMVWMFPAAFTSWWIFAYLGQKDWLLGIISTNDTMIALIVIEFIIFGIGLCLFVWGVILIAKARLNKTGLVQTGPYKYMRHPQHLGIILMSLCISLYIPWSIDGFIRIGEIVSWSLFSLVLIIMSDFEDKKLAKKFGDEFHQYRSSTGFFFPRIIKEDKERKSIYEIKYWKRYLLLGIGYLAFVSLISLVSYILRLPKVRIVGLLFDFLSKEFWYFNLICFICFTSYIILKKYRERKNINKRNI
ncbi:MAG: methyltransferase family protein [Candidatus Heimdallarchaeaceae archaeon]